MIDAEQATDLVGADYVVDALRHAINRGEFGLKEVPEAVRAIVDTDGWRDRLIVRTGERATFASFESFVETPPLAGLGTSLRQLKGLCGDDKAALDAIDRACQRPVGSNVPVVAIDNINTHPTGTNADQALRRLRKDRPDLHARVLAGEISPHAAMVQAGFRRRLVQVPSEPELAAKALWRRFTDEERARFIAAFTSA